MSLATFKKTTESRRDWRGHACVCGRQYPATEILQEVLA
jgi:hypothetical protein